jgi:hypothetical protein
MSAYALPGLFPPLSLDGKIDYNFDRCLIGVTTPKDAIVAFDEPDISVVVEDAKIDALELVKALTNHQQMKGSAARGRVRRRSTGSRYTMKQSLQQARIQPKSSASSEERCMMFTLRVSLNGRTFNVVRNLARIRCLHNELTEEAEYYDSEVEDSSIDPVLCSLSKRPLLPEFPNIRKDGVSTTNFGVLNALLKQYKPSLQSWLNDVFTIVAPNESPSLTYFLCEPMVSPQPTHERLTRGKSSPARLESIVEEERGEED